MNPPRIALYSRYAVFGNAQLLRVLRMRDSIISGSTAAIACLIGMSPDLTARARPAEHYDKETIT
jgi:hypothetical protein